MRRYWLEGFMRRAVLKELCQSGEVLCHARFMGPNGGVVERWWLELSGTQVDPSQADWLLGFLEPSGDGLFGDSQTWRMRA
jgi:hypothetical protein